MENYYLEAIAKTIPVREQRRLISETTEIINDLDQRLKNNLIPPDLRPELTLQLSQNKVKLQQHLETLEYYENMLKIAFN